MLIFNNEDKDKVLPSEFEIFLGQSAGGYTKVAFAVDNTNSVGSCILC